MPIDGRRLGAGSPQTEAQRELPVCGLEELTEGLMGAFTCARLSARAGRVGAGR